MSHAPPQRAPASAIRRVPLTSLLRAAARTFEREVEAEGEQRRRRLRDGVASLFDLSDVVGGEGGGRLRREHAQRGAR